MAKTKFLEMLKKHLKDSQKGETKDNLWLINNGLILRRTVGILGMLLPLLIWTWLVFTNCEFSPLPSISHYYYTRASSIFAITLSLVGIFLIIYQYEDKPADFISSTIAGIFALCVILFPTGNLSSEIGYENNPVTVTNLLPKNETREKFHLASAAIFLGCLAYMSICLFTKSNENKENRKKSKIKRNRIYRTCGVIMISALGIILSRFICEKLFSENINAVYWMNFYEKNKLTFVMEALAVESFGFSWLIKGKTFFLDEKN
jgi:hypothetical protein